MHNRPTNAFTGHIRYFSSSCLVLRSIQLSGANLALSCNISEESLPTHTMRVKSGPLRSSGCQGKAGSLPQVTRAPKTLRKVRDCEGVDGSERIAGMAKRIVAANGLASEQGGPISILSGRLEALASLPVEQVRPPPTPTSLPTMLRSPDV